MAKKKTDAPKPDFVNIRILRSTNNRLRHLAIDAQKPAYVLIDELVK